MKMLRIGETVKIWIVENGLAYWHYGISDGQGCVIHCSKIHKQVVIELEKDFSGGREIKSSQSIFGRGENAYYKACQFIGAAYDLFQGNCEHFVRMCHGMDVESTQIQKYLITTGASAIAIGANNPILKLGSTAVALAAILTPEEKSPLPNVFAVCFFVTLGAIALKA